MIVHYKQSIKDTIDECISNSNKRNQEIDRIELSSHEYVQFLEEIGTLGQMLIKDPFTGHRKYRGVQLFVSL